MSNNNELRGYARKKALGLVPHVYPAKDKMRGVVPPIGAAEAQRHQTEAAARRSARSR